jgi:hypothetical protein
VAATHTSHHHPDEEIKLPADQLIGRVWQIFQCDDPCTRLSLQFMYEDFREVNVHLT